MAQRKILSFRQERLTPGAVISALDHYLPENRGVADLPAFRPAAVLVPLVMRENGLTILFTRRSRQLTHHAGQVCFPGGRVEPGEDPVRAALRESNEEIGLAIENARVIGRLAPCFTNTRFSVTPVVALVRTQTFTPSPAEVAEIFEMPLDRALRIGDADRQTCAPALMWRGRFVTGATARMLKNLADVVRGP